MCYDFLTKELWEEEKSQIGNALGVCKTMYNVRYGKRLFLGEIYLDSLPPRMSQLEWAYCSIDLRSWIYLSCFLFYWFLTPFIARCPEIIPARVGLRRPAEVRLIPLHEQIWRSLLYPDLNLSMRTGGIAHPKPSLAKVSPAVDT